MTRGWLETSAQPEYHRLCACTLALGRAATARLIGREDERSTFGSPEPKRSEVTFKACAAELRAAWLAAEQVVPGGGPLGRLGRLLRISDSFIEPMLLAMIAAPALDRTVARAYARLDGPAMTAGFLVDLASTSEANRIALYGALHPDAALRRNGVLIAGDARDARDGDDGRAIAASTALAVAPAVLSTLRCEPVPLPRGVDELAPVAQAGPATRVLDALGVPHLAAGNVAFVVGGAAHTEALARLYAAAHGSVVWRVRPDDHGEPAWAALLCDAALANAICLVTAATGGPWLRRLRWAVDRAMRSVVCAIPLDQVPHELAPPVELARVRLAARPDDVRAQADGDPITAELVDAVLG